jgi:hypothetical protein
MATPMQHRHEFESRGAKYVILAALVADQPAVYAVEVTRNPGKGSHGTPLVTMLIRSDYDHAFVEDAGVLKNAFEQGERMVRAMYL